MTARDLGLGLLSALLLFGGACAGEEPSVSPSAAEDPALAQAAADAEAFQAGYDAELRADDHSFLTAVAAFYIQPGNSVGLAHDAEGSWARSETPSVRATATEAGLQLELDGEQRELGERTLVAVDADGRFALMCSPQESSWRVLVHDRDAVTRREFEGIAWFPVDPAFVVEARYVPSPAREPTVLQTSRGETKTLYLAAQLEFELEGAAQALQAFAYVPEAAVGEELLVPFKDATTGKLSYGAGRYLELEAPAGEALTLDFNRATNPLCAYSKHYNCPMPPRFNALEPAITAGAQAPADH